MPGIVGLITRMPRKRAEAELRAMIDSMSHETFYVTDTWIDEALGVYVGSIARRGSFSQGMPVRNESGNVVLVFAGEEFTEAKAGKTSGQRGQRSSGPAASYLVDLYEEDLSFPAGLNGKFHGILADRNLGRVTLFNDRYGMQRLYCHESDEGFYFAAEAKAILAVHRQLRSIDSRGFGEFISCGAVLENRTLFSRIELLPPASAWIFRSGILESKGKYFQPATWEEQELLDSGSFYRELREVFGRRLPRYFDGAEQIAMSLTGGLDTRMIMAWQRAEPGTLPCYTFGGMYHECQDVTISRRVADVCKQTHHVIPVGNEFLTRFPHYAERATYLSDGCVDVSLSPDLYVSERARQIGTIRMTGNYGGEILRGVRAFRPTALLQGLFAADVLPYIRRAERTYSEVLVGHPVSFAVFRQAPWHHYGPLALEQTQLFVRSPYLDNDFVRTIFRAPRSVFSSNELSLQLIGDGNKELLKVPTDRGLAGTRQGTHAHLSRALLEFQFKAEYAYDMGMPQTVARIDHIFSMLHLERLFLGRHKAFHFRVWYRDMLAAYVQEILLDSRSLNRPYIDRKQLEAVVKGHIRGDRNYTNEIHKALTLELIHRIFVD